MKLRNKLILSCAALAAVATTAVSTTFAWYTSNTDVTATGITAASATSGDDLLLVADGLKREGSGTAQSPYTYSEVAFADLDWKTNISGVTMTNNELKPLAYNSVVKKLVDVKTDPTVTTTSTEVALTNASAAYMAFELYFKNASGSAKNIYISSMTIQNVTGKTLGQNGYTGSLTLPSKTVVNPADNYANFGFQSAAAATSYTIDALRALQIDVETYAVSSGSVAQDTTAENVLDPEGIVSLGSDTITTNSANAYNAHTYYNSIMDTDLSITEDKTVKTTLTKTGTNYFVLGSAPSAATTATMNDAIKVVFKVFLNGWDLACFDACQGQNFAIDLAFTVVDPTGEGVDAGEWIKTPANNG